MKLSLVVLNAGKASGQAIPVTAQQFVIGRDPECNLRPASVLISKRHCALFLRDDQASVRDFDSTNGTFLNEKQVKGEVPLSHGDTLKVGPLSFKVVLESVSADKATPPRPSAVPIPKKATPAKASADEDAAALLLSLDDTPLGGKGSVDAMGVPEGSTIMDLPTKLPTPAPATKEEAAPAGQKKEPKEPTGAAQNAAKAILDKYSKRQR